MQLSKLVIAVMTASVGFGTVCQAQMKNPAQLVGSWGRIDATGKISTFLAVTCNDVWEATTPGKPAVAGRGAIRIISADGGYVIAENRSILGFNKQAATGPLKITQAPDGATTTVEWAGKKQSARLFQTSLGEQVLEVKDISTRYYVQCPVNPGKTANDPYTPPAPTHQSYYGCQVLSEQVGRNYPVADIKARFTSYALSWRDALNSLPSGDLAGARQAVDARWAAATGDQRTNLIGTEIDRCGGAAPGFPEAQITVPPAPPSSAGRGR